MDHMALGRLGERLAVQHLKDQGWEVRARNVRHGRAEVDVVASRGSILAFIEVKCRRTERHGHPLEAITRSKRLEVARVARGWLRKHPIRPGVLVRFDAISVLCPYRGPHQLIHVPDAWRMD